NPPVTVLMPSLTASTGALPTSQATFASAIGSCGWARGTTNAAPRRVSARRQLRRRLIAPQSLGEAQHVEAFKRPTRRLQLRRRPKPPLGSGVLPVAVFPEKVGVGEAEVGARFARRSIAKQGEPPGQDPSPLGREALDPVTDRDGGKDRRRSFGEA